MARRSRARRRAQPVEAEPPARTSELARPPEVARPAFWFGFEVPWAKLAVGRVLLFGLLAFDALLQIRHAPRYGAGGFNVAQLPGLDDLGPTRISYAVAQLVESYLLMLAAFGIATRVVLPVAAAIYAWLYFSSLLDGFQHHYLVVLVLVIASFIPWAPPEGTRPDTRVRVWGLRLLLVQIGIMYLWAAISKLDGAWLDGGALTLQLGGTAAVGAAKVTAFAAFIEHTVGWALAAKLVLIAELVLALTVWVRPAWIVAAPLGIALHLGIAVSGLEIGQFAWLMLAMYVFVVPDRVWVALANLRPVRALATVIPRGGGWWVLVAIVGASSVLAVACRLEHALVVGLALALVAIAIALARRGTNLAPVACAHLAALVLWIMVDRVSNVSADYFNLWGGSARRLGDLDGSERAYRGLVALDPADGNARYKLGRVLLERDHEDEGLAELHLAQRLEPHAARAWLAEARWLLGHGHPAAALAAARAGAAAEPASTAATDLVSALASGAPPAPPHDD